MARADRDELFEIAYEELRAIASRMMRGQKAGHTLQTTDLVHQAYMNLKDRGDGRWNDKDRLLGIAAQAMRNILVDHARRKATKKRGGSDRQRVTLSGQATPADSSVYDVLDLDAALTELAQDDARASEVAEMKLFAGLTDAEIATHLKLHEKKVERIWRTARANLKATLGDGDDR